MIVNLRSHWGPLFKNVSNNKDLIGPAVKAGLGGRHYNKADKPREKNSDWTDAVKTSLPK